MIPIEPQAAKGQRSRKEARGYDKKSLSIIILSFSAMVFVSQTTLAQIPLQHSDGEILGLSFVIEESEVQEASLAMQKHINKEVLDYAKMLNQEIGEHLNGIQDLSRKSGIGIVESALSIDQVRRKSEKDLAALARLEGPAFAQLYLTDTIKGHTEVLNWIDSQPAQKSEVKIYLKETRMNVARNLDRAIVILKHQTKGQL